MHFPTSAPCILKIKGSTLCFFSVSPLKHIFWLFICNCNKNYAFIDLHRKVFFSLDFTVQKYLKLGTFCVIFALIETLK